MCRVAPPRLPPKPGPRRNSPSPALPCLKRAQVLATRFTKSAIRSRAALTYAEAQSRIDDERLTDEISVRPSCPLNLSVKTPAEPSALPSALKS